MEYGDTIVAPVAPATKLFPGTLERAYYLEAPNGLRKEYLEDHPATIDLACPLR